MKRKDPEFIAACERLSKGLKYNLSLPERPKTLGDWLNEERTLRAIEKILKDDIDRYFKLGFDEIYAKMMQRHDRFVMAPVA
jgi:hypothetical protein